MSKIKHTRFEGNTMKESDKKMLMLIANGKWTVFVSRFQLLNNTSQHSPIHTLRADDFSTKSQPAHQELIHTHSHTNGAAIRSNLGFSILPKYTSTCRPQGIKPLTYWLNFVCLFVCFFVSLLIVLAGMFAIVCVSLIFGQFRWTD